MPKLLLISFHYRPFGAVASERAKAWAENLSKLGWQVDVLTHHWVQSNEDWSIPNIATSIEDVDQNLRLIRLGINESRSLPSNSVLRKFSLLKDWLSGWFDPTPLAWSGHRAMQKWAKENINSDSYDAMMGIYSPFSHLSLCHEIHKRTQIPYFMDFRDLWDNLLVNDYYKPSGTKALRHKLILFYWKRYLKDALGISAATDTFSKYLSARFEKECITLYSGFEAERLKESHPPASTFDVIYTGSLYNHQHYKAAVQGLKIFLNKEQADDIQVSFHGIKKEGNTEGSAAYSDGAAEFIERTLNDKRVFIGPRISYIKVRELQAKAQVLLLPTHEGVPGIIPGKLFEYMGNKTRILSIPTDEFAIARILNESGAGVCVESPEDFANLLGEWYSEWKSSGELQALYPIEQRMKYSQAHQAEKLSKFMLARLS